ncbi:MAG: phosphonopyruvate decarboxylase [Myxococcales bacterium]|nr:phosphonopyruvate decarboxylase [Myxococcales bacterium]
MIRAETFVDETRRHGFALWSGVPCSYLKPFINYVIDDPTLTYMGAANEGDAVAIASGADLGGKRAVVMFQNSGFGNTVNPVTSLNMIFKVPVLIITTLRGEPGGPHDEPQHELMGEITPGLFDLMQVPWAWFPTEESEVAAVLARAVAHMDAHRTPFGLIMKKDSVSDHKLKTRAEPRSIAPFEVKPWSKAAALPSRRDVLAALQASASPTDAFIATTGFTGRALYALDDRPSQLYMVGSMGCASTFGLGLAWAQPQRKVIVLDGDGAALMRLGAFATLGYERPTNLVHVLLDNEVHDSTGGQSTVSHSVDLAGVAAACGYPKVVRAHTAAEVARLAAEATELTFIHVKTAPGESKDLPRPKETPVQVIDRMRAWLKETA